MQYKNRTALRFNAPDYHLRFILGNSFINWTAHYVPKDHNNDEKSLELKHKSQYKPGKHYFNTVQSLRLGTPKVGPLRFFIDVRISFSTLDTNYFDLNNKLIINIIAWICMEHKRRKQVTACTQH